MVRRRWRKLGPLRSLSYGVLVLTIVVVYGGLEPFAPPCEDLIDGACEYNWASDAQWAILPLLLLASIAPACLAAWDLGRLVLRRWRRSEADAKSALRKAPRQAESCARARR